MEAVSHDKKEVIGLDIGLVLKIIKKELGATIKADYYNRINTWAQWWKGRVESFHEYNDVDQTGIKHKRRLYSLKMAKKICEDWASSLLNEKTKVVIGDNASSIFVQGEENENGGAFKALNFWSEANRLVEKSFYSGTGVFVMKLDDLDVDAAGNVRQNRDTKLRMEYLPAFCIVPLTVKYGKIVEEAIASEQTIRGKRYIYIEMHLIENGLYTITNKYYEVESGEPVERELEGIAPIIKTGSPYPFFSNIHPNIVNPYEDNLGLGCSVYAHAIDSLKGVDLAFNNFCRDFKLGGKKVFYNRDLTKTIGLDKEGNPVYITPDDMMQQLFVSIGDGNIEEKNLLHEFNPDLRVQDNRDGLQAQLDYLSFKCGLGTRRYRFDTATQAVTATQYAGERQELRQNAEKHGTVIKEGLQDIIRAILWAGKNVLGESVDPETDISVELSDGYIVSDEEQREIDRQDVRDGLLQKWEYRVRWRHDDEKTAKERTQPIGPVYGTNEYGAGEDE